jgi:hypothetical protein
MRTAHKDGEQEADKKKGAEREGGGKGKKLESKL